MIGSVCAGERFAARGVARRGHAPLAPSPRDWLATLPTASRIAVEEGHSRNGVAPDQLSHELLTLECGHHLISRLLRDPSAVKRTHAAIERLLGTARASRN